MESLDILEYFVKTGFLDCVFRCLYCLFCNFLNLCCYFDRMIIMTSVCRGGVMFELFSFWASCIDCVSGISHPRSGILLVGYCFSSFLSFSSFLFLIKFTDFLCHGYFLNVSAVYFGYVSMIVFDLYLVLSQKSYYAKILVFWLECF